LIRVLGDVRAANQMNKRSQTHLCAPADSKPAAAHRTRLLRKGAQQGQSGTVGPALAGTWAEDPETCRVVRARSC
jgi:hypothetical protein